MLKEDSNQKHVGTFTGNFVSSFYLGEQDKIEYGWARFFSDNCINNQFSGIWTPYDSNISKECNWGDFRIPNVGKLDIGTGDFSPSAEYLVYGWQSYSDAYTQN